MTPEQVEQRTQTIALFVLAAVALGAALRWLRPVMIPFVLAVFFASGLMPLVRLQMRRLRMPRGAAIAATLLLSLVLFTGVGLLVSASVRELAASADRYQAEVASLTARVAEALPLERFGIEPGGILAPLSQVPVSALGGMLVATTNAILDLLSNSALVFLFVVYLLIAASAGPERREGLVGQIGRQVERYLLTKAAVSAATGLLTWLVLAGIGVDLALVFGLLAFLLNFIPSIGSVIATLLPLPVVIVSPDLGTGAAVAAIAIPGAIQFTIGNVIEPRILGSSMDLHPVTILLALILWGMLWGVVGMFLATPITAVMRILFERLELTRPLAGLLAGRLRPEGARAPV